MLGNSLSEATIDRIAKDTKFMARKGKVPPSCFMDTLLFNDNDMASTSLPNLTADLNQVHGIDISKEAMHKKFKSESVDFLKGLLGELLSAQLKNLAAKGSLLHFPRIMIKDSTRFSLPDSYGDFSKKNGFNTSMTW